MGRRHRPPAGLVDGFGGLDEAIAKAAELAKLGDERGVRYLERARTSPRKLLEMALAGEEEDERRPADAFACLAPAPGAAARGAGRCQLDPHRVRHSGPLPRMRAGWCGAALEPMTLKAGWGDCLAGAGCVSVAVAVRRLRPTSSAVRASASTLIMPSENRQSRPPTGYVRPRGFPVHDVEPHIKS